MDLHFKEFRVNLRFTQETNWKTKFFDEGTLNFKLILLETEIQLNTSINFTFTA